MLAGDNCGCQQSIFDVLAQIISGLVSHSDDLELGFGWEVCVISRPRGTWFGSLAGGGGGMGADGDEQQETPSEQQGVQDPDELALAMVRGRRRRWCCTTEPGREPTLEVDLTRN
jgi:hypothetical protein